MTKQHLHIYKRDRTRKTLYRCVDPDCTHFTYKYLLEGNRVACFECHNEMIMTPYNLTTAMPKCDNCSNHKRAKELKAIKEVPEISKLFNESLPQMEKPND